MVTLKNVFEAEVAKTKDEFIEWVIDYRELNGTLEYGNEYNEPVGMDEEETKSTYDLTVDGERYTLDVVHWEGSTFIINEADYEYDEDGKVLYDDAGFPYGTLHTKSVVARLYNTDGDLLEEEEYFEHGLDYAKISYHVIDDVEHVVYIGHMGYEELYHRLPN